MKTLLAALLVLVASTSWVHAQKISAMTATNTLGTDTLFHVTVYPASVATTRSVSLTNLANNLANHGSMVTNGTLLTASNFIYAVKMEMTNGTAYNPTFELGVLFNHLTASRAVVLDANGRLTNSAGVTATELEYLNDVTSDIQAQIDAISGGSGIAVNGGGGTNNSFTNVSFYLGALFNQATASRMAEFDANGRLTNSIAATGTGAPVLANTPTLVTPVLTVPVIGDMSGATHTHLTIAGGGDLTDWTNNTHTVLRAELSTVSNLLEVVKLDQTNGTAYNPTFDLGVLFNHLTVSRAVVLDANGRLTNSAGVTATELEYLNDVTSDIQAQIDAISGGGIAVGGGGGTNNTFTNVFFEGAISVLPSSSPDGTVTVNVTTNQIFLVTLTQDTTVTMAGGTTSYEPTFILTQDATGGWDFTVDAAGQVFGVVTNGGESTVVSVNFTGGLTNATASRPALNMLAFHQRGDMRSYGGTNDIALGSGFSDGGIMLRTNSTAHPSGWVEVGAASLAGAGASADGPAGRVQYSAGGGTFTSDAGLMFTNNFLNIATNLGVGGTAWITNNIGVGPGESGGLSIFGIADASTGIDFPAATELIHWRTDGTLRLYLDSTLGFVSTNGQFTSSGVTELDSFITTNGTSVGRVTNVNFTNLTAVVANKITTIGPESRYREVWIDAGAMVPHSVSATNPAAIFAYEPPGANGTAADSFAFDGATSESVHFKWAMPDDYDGGTIKAKFHWTQNFTNDTEAVKWGISAGAISDNDGLGAVLGTRIEVADTCITTNDLHISSATAAITILGTPALGDLVQFKVERDPADAGDTMSLADALLLGVQIQYKENAGTSVIW